MRVKETEGFLGKCFWQECKDEWKPFVLPQRWLGVTRRESVWETTQKGEWEQYIKDILFTQYVMTHFWAQSEHHLLRSPCSYTVFCQAFISSPPPHLLRFSFLSPHFCCSLRHQFLIPNYPCINLLALYLTLHLSVRGMSFNMPPVTSRSQEAHPTSHSPCPLFLNEGHMCCGQLWS